MRYSLLGQPFDTLKATVVVTVALPLHGNISPFAR